MNTPKLRFKEFSGKLSVVKLSEIATFYSGGTPLTSKREYFNGDIPFIRSGEINSDLTEQFISDIGFKNSSAKMVDVGDILYALYGATSGEVAISKIKGAINQAILCIKSNQNHYYLYSYLKFQKENITKMYLQGGQGNLSAEIVKNLTIPLPQIPEQQKIASFFTAVDQKLIALKKKKELLEQYKKGVMQQIFSQKVRFKDENGNPFPEWEEKKLGEVCEINKGQQLNKENLEDFGKYPALNGGVLPSGYTNKWNTLENTIAISEGGNSCGFVNFMKEKFWSGGHCYTISNLIADVFNEYLFHFLKHNEFHIMNMRVGSGLPNIQKKDILNFKILFPASKEQQKIADFLSAIDNKINAVAQQIENTEQWKKGLLQQMFV